MLHLKATVTSGDLCILGVDASELYGVAASELVHGCLGKVEAGSGVIDCQNVDSRVFVCYTIASAAL